MNELPKMDRRRLLHASAAALATSLAAAPTLSLAQPSWPARPIRVIVPYAAGQGADVLTRLAVAELQKTLGQPLVVENRSGAGGNIGTAAAAKAAPDGYTFLMGTNATHAANEFLFPHAGFNPATAFEPVAMIGVLPAVLSTTLQDIPANGLPQLVARARSMPDKLAVGLTSTTAQVVFEQLVRASGAPLLGVKYRASGQAMTDALGGQIPLVIDTVTATRPHLKSGALKALAVSSPKPTDLLPGVKTMAEQGVPGMDLVGWDAFFAPRGTPRDIVQKLSEHLRVLLVSPDFRQKLLDIGVEPLFMPPAELDAFAKAERKKWGGIITAAGIKAE
jgi:tripartite-type tricarboxylate transporter receptor subunit TctC